MVWLTDVQKIGAGCTVFGLLFQFLGVVTLFDGALLALGNLLFLAGVTALIGPRKTAAFFARPDKLRGSLAFFLGLVLVLVFKRPFIGVLIQGSGFLNLFGDFFPTVLSFLRQLPFIGTFLSLPYIRGFADRLVGAAAAPPPR